MSFSIASIIRDDAAAGGSGGAGVAQVRYVRGPEDLMAAPPTPDSPVASVRYVVGPEDLMAAPAPDTVASVRYVRGPEDLMAAPDPTPPPPPPPATTTIAMEGLTLDLAATPGTLTRVPFRVPLPPGVVGMGDVGAGHDLVRCTRLGAELACLVDGLRDDAGNIVPHHLSAVGTNGIDPATASPLMLVGAVELPLNPGTPEDFAIEFGVARTLTLTGAVPAMTFADQGAHFLLGTDVTLAQDIWHIPFGHHLPRRCAATLLQYMKPGVTFRNTTTGPTTQRLKLNWNTRDMTFTFDTANDPAGPVGSSAYELVAQCDVVLPAGAVWTPGVTSATAAGITINVSVAPLPVRPLAGALGVTEAERRIYAGQTQNPAFNHLDNARSLIKTYALPAWSTQAKRDTAAAYLKTTHFLSDDGYGDTVPVTVRKAWGYPNNGPDVCWDHDALGGYEFGRAAHHRETSSTLSSSASYNVGEPYAARWLDTGSPFWWHMCQQSCVAIDRLLWDVDGDNAGGAAGQSFVRCGWQHAVGYALSGIARHRAVLLDIAADTYENYVYKRMRTSVLGDTDSRRTDTFALQALAGCQWLGLQVPTTRPAASQVLTRVAVNFTSWEQAMTATLRGLRAATAADGYLPQSHNYGFNGTLSTCRDINNNPVGTSPKPYWVDMTNHALWCARTFAMPRWNAASRATFTADARDQMARTLAWNLAYAYDGSPLGGTPKPPGQPEGFLYTTQYTVVMFAATATASDRTVWPVSSHRKFDATLGQFVRWSDPLTSDGFLYEDRSAFGYAGLCGFTLAYLGYLARTETDPAKKRTYRLLGARVWRNAVGYSTTAGIYTFGGTNKYVGAGGSAKYFGEAFTAMHAGAPFVQDVLINGP
jgi:hypothetical protein